MRRRANSSPGQSNPDAALNFGLDDHVEHGERYCRTREFYDVVTGLWDGFADDTFVRDRQSGLYPPIRREGKLLVLGTVDDDDNDRDAGFDCRFEQNGAYLGIIGAPAE